MRNKWIYVAMLVLSFSLAATACDNLLQSSSAGGGNLGDTYEDYNPNKQPGGDQFDHDGNYVAPELTIDGKGEDAQWKAITEPLATFGNGNAATVKAYRGDNALFFLFEVQDKILLTEGETNDDAVTRSDSIEFYLDTLANGGLKPQSDDYQINLGIHGKTRIMQGSGSGWGNWNGLIDYEVSLNGTLNDGVEAADTGYSVEVMIPYTQINIEKDDTIAISFGQVDKVGAGNAATTDWDWYPWVYNGVITEPQTPNNYVLLDKDNVLMARDEEKKPNAEMAGYVLDSATAVAIEGATVTVVIGEETKTTTTDASGFFSFANVDPEGTYTVTIGKDGYISNSATYTRAELRAANGGRVQKDITIINETTVARTKLTGTVKNLIDGAIGGATIRIEGTVFETTANADGTFEIADVPVEEDKDITVVFSKAGYGDSKTLVKYEALVTAGDAVTALGDVNINLPYAQTGGFGNKSDFFADSMMTISRTLTGIEFNLTGTRQLSGHIEVYIDVKDCADHRDNDANFWCFNLNDTGYVTGNHYAGGAFSAEGLEYTLYKNDASGYSARFFVPYSYLDITPLEVFGVSLGQWSTTASDWDGWGYAGQFVAPETPKTLIRVSATNELYRADSNLSMVNLSGNVGMQGVRITVVDYATTSGADGSWNLKVPATSEAMSIVYTCQGYEPKTTTIEAGYFDTNYSFRETVELETQRVSVSGKVTDKDTGAGIANATVSIVGTDISATTDAEGNYTLTGVSTANAILIKVSADDYARTEITVEAETLSSQATHMLNVELIAGLNIQYVTASGVVTNVNGPVAYATVTVEGNSDLTATTDSQGRFTIENFAGVDCKVIITKDGYLPTEIAFKASALDEDVNEYDFGEVDMMLEYGVMQGIIADKADTFAAFKGYVTRSATGFEFKFVGLRAFTGRVELFVDTKASSADNARDTSDYLFNLNADGTIAIVNWGEGEKNETVPSNMIFTVKNAETKPEIYFTLPYAFLGVEATEVIGISAGQWNGSDWDGWDNFNLIGINNAEFVKPEWTQDYVRIAADNTLYAKADNVAVDFSSYQIHFGTGMMTTQTGNTEAGALGNAGLNADDMYAKIAKRDENGVTFEIITTGNFGTNSNTNEKEMILIYFDTGAESKDGWQPDYLLKIFSDGTVYGRATNAWWSASEADKLGTTATITTENGVTKIVYTVTYETIGIGATDVFGIAMREASHNAGDHMLYDPWHDCYFENETTGIDAAACTQFIRVSANGTLYRDNNNNAND